MLTLTSLEKTLLAVTFIVVGVLGYTLYERHEGSVQCVAAQSKAATKETHVEKKDADASIASLQQQMAALPASVPAAPPLRVCVAPRVVRQVAASASVQSVAPTHPVSDPGVQARNQSGSDIGPAMQDITLAGVLCVTQLNNLWQLEVKEGSK